MSAIVQPDVLPTIPIALKIGGAALLVVIGLAYWRVYGPGNFLWLSDLALASVTLALLFETPLLASMAAVGVLPLELLWTIDFLSGARLFGYTASMFDARSPLSMRALSLFHLALPPIIIFLLAKLGYDGRALLWQTVLTWIALVLSYRLTEPERNVNWVFGPVRPQDSLPPPLYLGLEMLALPCLVFAPMHLLLERLLPSPHG
jgi:hypothetical protein